VPSAASVHWEEGQRERWLAELAPPKRAANQGSSPDADEEILDRILHAVERKRPVRDAEIAALSDAGAFELFEEIPNELSARACMHLLARLGDRAAEPLIAIAAHRLPSTALVAVLEPIESPAVATLMARVLAGSESAPRPIEEMRTERWSPSVPERWLERFAETAVIGLAPAAVDLEDRGQKNALAGLRFVAARGHADAIRAGLARFSEDAGPLRDGLLDLVPLAGLVEEGGEGLDWVASLLASGHLDDALALTAPLDHSHLVRPMARWLAEGTSAEKELALGWLRAHEAIARETLGSLEGHDAASHALEMLDSALGSGARDALDRIPEQLPPMGDLWDPEALPAPLTLDGAPLELEAIGHLGTMLRFSPFRPAYAGLAQVKEACDAASLDAFALALLGRWVEGGSPATELWMLYASGHLGGERCAAEVRERLRSWAHQAQRAKEWESQLPRALTLAGLEALALNGTDAALVHIAELAKGGGASWIRRAAEQVLEQLRTVRDLPKARLEDELVPDFGLGAEGALVLDYGPRQFSLRFDENLRPVVIDEAGQPKKSLPRARKTDDEAKAESAKRRVRDLEAAVKALAKSTLRRLEQAMITGHRWTVATFRAHHAEHPLLRYVATHLVWGAMLGDRLDHAFRVAEDGTFANVDDEATTIPEGAKVGLVHPIDLADELPRWTELFADHQLLQPFEQLAREVSACPAGDAVKTELPADRDVSSGRLSALRHRGWAARTTHVLGTALPIHKSQDDDGADRAVHLFERELPDGHLAWIAIEPGLISPKDTPTQRVTRVRSGASLGALSAVAYSELMRDVKYLMQ
jgi:hypothetical protein